MASKEPTYTIDAQGVAIELQPRATEDIRKLVGGLVEAADRIGCPYKLHSVLLTSQFQDDVNRLLRERSGLTGYVAARSNAHAIGKTLWTRSLDGDIGFSVVIDATQIGSWSLNNARCLTTVLHELTHVLYETRHLKRLGETEYTAVGDTRERLLDRSASLLIDEFDVDRTVDALVKGLAKKDDGSAWSLRELEEAQNVDWPRSLVNGLSGMPQVVDEKVWRFRTRRMGIDDLVAQLIPFVNDLLTLLSHTAAIYLATEGWPEILGRIRQTAAYRRFLSEHLDTILSQLDSTQVLFPTAVETVASSIEGIFRNCGLSLQTVDEGVYIGVQAPAQ